MTEQEQIKAIKQIIDERVETTLGYVQGRHDNVIKTVDTVIIARDIVNAGYGDVYEYKFEIERQAKQIAEYDEWFKFLQEQRNKATEENGKLKRENYQLKEEYNNVFELLKAKQREIDRLKAEQVGVQNGKDKG